MNRLTLLALISFVTAACADQGAVPPKAASGPPPSLPPLVSANEGAPAAIPTPAPSESAPLMWTLPAGWTEEAPSSPMRYAQYRVPGDAECAVFYFGPGQGGDPMSNAKRWAGQFKLPDGSPALGTMKTSNMTMGGRAVLLVEVAGTYDGGMTMTAAPSTPKPGYALLGAVVEGPDANWFFKLTGPEATIATQREPFLSLLKSLK